MYALGLGNFLDALSQNDVGVDPPALDLRQRIESVPQAAEPLLELQQFIGQAEYSIPSSQSREYCALFRDSRRW